MLTQPLSGGDDRTRGMIGVSSPTAFPLAIVGDDVTAGQTGVSSSLSTPPHPCAFSSPSSVTPPNSHTPVPLSIHINPPPPPFSVSLSTPPFMLTHSASSLPPISSPPLPPPHSPFFSIFLNPSLLPPPSLSLPPFSPPPLPSTTSHSSSSSSSISILPSPSISPPTLSHFSTPSSSCHLLPSFIHPSPSYLCSSVSSFSLPSFSSPAPPSPHLSVICSPSPSPSVSTTLHPSSPPPPPPPPSCCPCSSLLPRLLSTHQMEVRRILRGALSSLGRRLDFFEKKSRRKRRRRIRQARKDPPAFTCSSSPTSIPPLVSSSSPSPTSFSTSLSLDREDSHTLISKSEQSNSKEGEKKMGARKRRNSQVEVEEEEDAGRFVGQMAVSFTRQGGGAEALLTLHDFNHKRREQGETGQPEKDASVVVRQNGYSSTSHHPLHRLQSAQSGWTSTQSEAACRSFVQWHFSNSILSTSLFSNHRFSHRRLCCFLSFSPTSMLQLSAVSVETVSKLLKGEACESPLWPLKDWTAPPSLSSDHCYVRLLTPSLTFSAKGQRKQRDHHIDQSAHPPQRWPLLLPPCSANGLFAPIPANQSAVESRFLITNAVRSKRVSQIRIRRATPRETPLTPMGLPKIRRLKKKEFSLEEIYTNKNYKSPTTNRSLETIFEEPREKDGAMFLIGQQRRRRLLLFPDFTQPRKRKKPQGAGLPVAVVPRKRTARRHCHGDGSCDDNVDLDVMLVERLSALEDFLTQQGLDF